MPYSDDRSIVTCAADGQVRHAQILERDVNTKLLAKHHGRAHKLAIEPGSPYIFYTCGEDGLVQHIDLRTAAATELFTCRPLDDSRRGYMPFIHLNAIAIDPRNPNLFAVAGSDEYTRLYDIRKYKWNGSTDFGQPTDCFCPVHLIGDEQVGITGLAFSDQSELLVSYNDECIYLFTKDMGLGPNPVPSSPLSPHSEASEKGHSESSASSSAMEADEKSIPQVYKGHRNFETVKGVSFFGPRCEYVVSGSDCGRIFIWRKKGGELIRVIEADKHVVNCIESHPHTTVLASSGIETDIKIWTPKAEERAPLPENIEQLSSEGDLKYQISISSWKYIFETELEIIHTLYTSPFYPFNDEDNDDVYFYNEDEDENFDNKDDDDDDNVYHDDYDDGYMDDYDDEWRMLEVVAAAMTPFMLVMMKIEMRMIVIWMMMLIMSMKPCVQFKPKARPRGWMFRVASPEDLMLQLVSLQRRRSNLEENGENSSAGRELLELILSSFNADSDASSDDGEVASAPEDSCS
ncbi:hypothetical protein SLEP1_g33630 [Rubroshorea leprosula]|uniref:Uncharacterized protein n=1 Tax=Rubroshorea leprosula TaxID=152421 RepID=A0AAV5KHE2_9ROSI|nr:hypothetical protein SLEP1_g33630 [Rubroshorea leprosula]